MFEHLEALQARLQREQTRLDNSNTEHERAFRINQVAMTKKEIAGELKFLNAPEISEEVKSMTDDELLAALFS